MSTTTTKYGLLKPELTDAADITQTNRNWDIIDTELADRLEKSGGTLTGKLTIESTNAAHEFKDVVNGDDALINIYYNNIQIKKRNVTDDDDNYRRLILKDSETGATIDKALVIGDMVDGVESYYDIIHTGNLSRIKPTDIGALPMTVASATVG